MTLAGRYELLKPPLGTGSFGAVYLANDRKMPRQVAVKVLHASYASDAKVSARFLRELVAACRVSHENVIQVLDVGDDAEHGLFYVMEYAEGTSLEERLRQQRVPWTSLRVIALQLAAALDAIHQAGIVHRDLKPRNIMLVERSSQDDLVKVLDFGIAAIHEDEGEGDDMELTGTRMVVGTPPYMSPEQTYMKSDRERLDLVVDGRSDLYSLGVILFEMIAGRRPFAGDAHELALAHRHHAAILPREDVSEDIPKGFCDLVLRLLSKRPDERPPSAEQVLATLRSLDSGGDGHVSPGGKQQDVQDAATCIVNAVQSRVQEVTTLNAPAVSLSTMATEAEEDVDYSSVRASKAPIWGAIAALCLMGTWWAWPSSAPEATAPVAQAVPAATEVNGTNNAAGSEQPEPSVAPSVAEAQVVSLMVTSVPPGAEVLLDGVVQGETPLATTVPAKEAKFLLEIQLKGHELRQIPIAVAPHLSGKALVFNEVLSRERAKAVPKRPKAARARQDVKRPKPRPKKGKASPTRRATKPTKPARAADPFQDL